MISMLDEVIFNTIFLKLLRERMIQYDLDDNYNNFRTTESNIIGLLFLIIINRYLYQN